MKKFLKWFVIVIVVFGILGSFIDDEEVEEVQAKEVKKVEEVTEEEIVEVVKDYKALNEDFAYISSESSGTVIKISSENESYNVIAVNVDGNIWEASTSTDKLDFAKTVHNTIAGLIYEHNVALRGSTVLVHFYDKNGYPLAKQSLWSGEYKIER